MKKLFLCLSIILSSLIFAIQKDSLFIQQQDAFKPFSKYDDLFCDACGCAAGNGSSGFESLLNPKFIGVKYFSQHYKAKENLFTNDLSQDQFFNTIQIWGNIPLTKKMSLYMSLPFHFHEKKTLQGDIKVSGIGDANLMGIYEIFKSSNSYHQLNGGIGVKIPLGKFNEKGISGVNPSFQLGTGSWDYQMAVSYKYQKNLFAILLSTDYTIKTENKKYYRFGNQWNYSANGFYRLWRNENSILSGKLGLQGEVYDWNKQFGEKMPRTAGSALYGKLGFEISYKKLSFGSECMLPTYSNLASGDIEARSRVSIFINFGL